MTARYYCGDEERRALVRAHPTLNGIDFLEVVDTEAPLSLRQRLLVIRSLKALGALSTANVVIEGGVRVTPVEVLWALPLPAIAGAPDAIVPAAEKAFLAGHLAGEANPERVFVVRVATPGDYSAYTLVLWQPPALASGERPPPDGFDPRLAAIAFYFKVECPSDFDCKVEIACPPPTLEAPPIDYLAKDYASFRRLMFDRLSAVAPDWRERNPADLGVVLVELLAYVGDYLSYYQDAVATEAYLGTARRRISVRRHARLVDYFSHEGANARAWITVEVDALADGVVLLGPEVSPEAPGTRVLAGAGPGATLTPSALDAAWRDGAVVFETMHDLELHAELNEIQLYTWGDRACCVPAGATEATLVGPLPVRSQPSVLLGEGGLGPGDFLLFEERLGPHTGAAADADPGHRHLVRLVRVEPDVDPLNGTAVVNVAWHQADALPFPLCVSARTDPEHGARYVEGVSVARGNVVLADHGLTVSGETLGPVPAISGPETDLAFRPILTEPALTHAVPLPAGFLPEGAPPTAPEALAPAAAVVGHPPSTATPVVRLEADDGTWRPRRDLLASGPFAREFVVEMDEERRAHLRFGDDVTGKRPDAGLSFVSTYRVGNGLAGHVGAEALSRLITDQAGILRVRNPLAATGGHAPEPLEDIRQYAPQAFRVQQRAVTEADYAWAAEQHPEVAKAAATFRWTGSWYTVFVTIDRRGGLRVDDDFERDLRDHLNFYRMAGYDLEVDGPRPVPLDVALRVCVGAGYRRSDVKAELLEVLSNRTLPDGRRGLFHPDNWTFGQTVYLSQLIAAAAGVTGVESVEPLAFQRWGRLAEDELERGELQVGRLEIALLDNDPSLPENGRLQVEVGGGL